MHTPWPAMGHLQTLAALLPVPRGSEFDDQLMAPRHGFNGVADYYARTSCGPRLRRARVPCLVIHANDDPMVPVGTLLPYVGGRHRHLPPPSIRRARGVPRGRGMGSLAAQRGPGSGSGLGPGVVASALGQRMTDSMNDGRNEMECMPEISSARAAGFVRELEAVRARLQSGIGAADLRHVRRISWGGRMLSAVGYGLCVLGANPFSVLLIGLGRFTRWVLVAHTVLHRAYDKLEGAAPAWHSSSFGRGRRRWSDWFDWLQADDWQAQHNVDHHCYVGDERDPDRLAENLGWMKERPKWFRATVLLLLAATWKWTYYGPATRRATLRRAGHGAGPEQQHARGGSPGTLLDRELLVRSYLPYVLVHFVLIPIAFVPFGGKAVLGALINSVLGELLVNLHAFAVVAPTHTGVDIPIFHGKAKNRDEYFVRQVLGSVDYRGKGPLSDFLQGYMGYQIEHHLWPDLPLRQYPRARLEVEALCAKYGLPYRRHPLWKRIREMIRAVVGDERATTAQPWTLKAGTGQPDRQPASPQSA